MTRADAVFVWKALRSYEGLPSFGGAGEKMTAEAQAIRQRLEAEHASEWGDGWWEA